MRRLVLATGNRHKVAEFSELLGAEFEVVALSDLAHLPEVEETGKTFEENAILKALAASEALPDQLVIADDSGLEVAALSGAPGVRSTRYAGETASDSANVRKLLAEMQHISGERRRGRFRCVIALAQGRQVLLTFHGTVEGHIAGAASGEHGFGYDPIFVPHGHNQTFATLGAAVKHHLSHRAAAAARLCEYLTETRAD